MKPEPHTKNGLNRDSIKASFWVLASGFLAALCGAIVHGSGNQYTIYEILGSRYVCSFLFSGLYLLTAGISLKPKSIPLLLGRIVLGTLAVGLWIAITRILPISTAQALIYTAPVFTLVFSIIYRRQVSSTFSPILAALIFAAAFGVYLITQPVLSNWLYVVLALCGAACLSGASLFLKAMGKIGENPLLIVFYFSMISCVLGVGINEVTDDSRELSMLFDPVLMLLSFLTFLQQISVTLGWSRGSPILNALCQNSGILFAVLFGWMFFDESLSGLSSAGLLLLILCLSSIPLLR